MSEEKRIPALNLSAIEFPSDRITVGQLRKEQPEAFDEIGKYTNITFRTVNVAATIATERKLVEKAFAAALGLPDPSPNYSRRYEIDMLNDDYCRYGLSTGKQATTQLVRELEKAAKLQAKQLGGHAH
jgi:hypothetical protein